MGRILKPWDGIFQYSSPEEELPISIRPHHLAYAAAITFAISSMSMASQVLFKSNPGSAKSGNLLSIFGLILASAATTLTLLWVATFLVPRALPPLVSYIESRLSSISVSAPLETKVIERIVAVRCTCSGLEKEETLSDKGDDTPSEKDSGYSSPTEDTTNEKFAQSFPQAFRTVEECTAIHQAKETHELRDVEVIELTLRGIIPLHSLERSLKDCARAVQIRRSVVSRTLDTPAQSAIETSLLPYRDYDYASVFGCCAENVIGYMPLPVGVAGPLQIDGRPIFLPMATTEGTLIASTSRGCKAINSGGGVSTVVVADGMTRAPVVSFENVNLAAAAKQFIESAAGQDALRDAFNSTTRFGMLINVAARIAGSSLYLRFRASTGEAMGMNMVGKGVEAALLSLRRDHGFAHMKIISLSGNYCTDKKAAAINWIEGRGKSVVAEAIIPAEMVQKVLKCSVESLVKLNTNKNYIGSALAGVATGGFNAHAANIVTAIFLATGQDPAQNIESSNCITIMEELPTGALRASVSMPSIEVGTIGGGTSLAPQAAMLDFLGLKGESSTGDASILGNTNASMLARIIAGGVLAGELSLCAALVTGELVGAHMVHNRKTLE
ncbi:MAG: 3-hydroxy-3-methylglutaryl-coenzyme A (HMG-CoA) reductase isozyme [Icmadophila ericetorum]|nr:3-hydroxy-3-methylglutaryl-coenzyme A (HMG-CoA) reductase isozyme [Icmadophila ericetorum]